MVNVTVYNVVEYVEEEWRERVRYTVYSVYKKEKVCKEVKAKERVCDTVTYYSCRKVQECGYKPVYELRWKEKCSRVCFSVPDVVWVPKTVCFIYWCTVTWVPRVVWRHLCKSFCYSVPTLVFAGYRWVCETKRECGEWTEERCYYRYVTRKECSGQRKKVSETRNPYEAAWFRTLGYEVRAEEREEEVEREAVREQGVVATFETLAEAASEARYLNSLSQWQKKLDRKRGWVKFRRVYKVVASWEPRLKRVRDEETKVFSFKLVEVSEGRLVLYNPASSAVSVSLAVAAVSTSKGARLEVTDYYGSLSRVLGPGEKVEVPLLCLGADRVHVVLHVAFGRRTLEVRCTVRRVTPPLLDALIELMEPIDWNTFWVELAWSLLPTLGVGAAVTALLVCSPEVGSKVLVGLFLTSLLLIAVDVASRYTDFFYDVAVLGSWGAAAAKDPGRAACIALDVLLLFGAGVSLEDVRIALFEKGANPKVRARAWAHVIAAVVSAVVLGAVSMAAKRAVAQKFGEILTAELGPVLGEEAPEIKALVGLAEEVGVRKMKRVISECIPALRAVAESEEFYVLRSLLLKEFGAKIEFGDGVIKYAAKDVALIVQGDGLYLLLAREGGAAGRLKIGDWCASPLGKAVAVETKKGMYVLAKRAREFYEAMFRIAGEVGEEAFAALERVALGEGTEGAAALVARSMERLVEAGEGGAARRLAGLAARAYGEGRADVVERVAWAFDVLTRKKRIEEAERVLSVAERAASEGVWELCGGLLERVARAAEAKRWRSIGRWVETVEAALAEERFLRLARVGVVEFPEKGEYSVTASCGDLRVKVLGGELRVLVPEGESGGEVRYAARRLRELVFYENELGEWAVAVYEKAEREGARRSRAVYYLAERGYVWVKGGGPIGRASVALELGMGDEFRGVRVVGGYRVVVEFEPRSAVVEGRSVEAEGVVRVKLVDAFGNVVSSRAVPARARPEGGGFVVDFEVGDGRLKIVSEPSGEGAVDFEYGLSVVRSIGERGGRRKVDTRRIGRAVLTLCGSESPRPCVVLLATDESGRVWGRAVALEGLTFRGVKAQLAHSNPSEVSKRICREIWGIIREYMKRTEETSWTSNEAREYLKNSGFKILEEEIPDELIDRSNYIGKIGEKYAREVYSIEVSKTGPDLVSDYYVYEIKSIDLVTCKDEKILEQRIINQIRSALKDEIIQWIRSEKYISKFWDRKWKPKRVIIVLIGVVADTENNVVAARILEEVEVTVTWALGEP